MNLIPQKRGQTPSYWCTWSTQGYSRPQNMREESKSFTPSFAGDQGSVSGQDYLNEDLIFKDPGWAKHVLNRVKSDLYFMIDQGWDVPYDRNDVAGRWIFGELKVLDERFPSIKGEPAMRLEKLNRKIKEEGWRGLAL